MKNAFFGVFILQKTKKVFSFPKTFSSIIYWMNRKVFFNMKIFKMRRTLFTIFLLLFTVFLLLFTYFLFFIFHTKLFDLSFRLSRFIDKRGHYIEFLLFVKKIRFSSKLVFESPKISLNQNFHVRFKSLSLQLTKNNVLHKNLNIFWANYCNLT